MAHLESVQINDTLAQLRPADVLDNGITRNDGVENNINAQDGSKQPKTKSKEAVPTVAYYKLFRSHHSKACLSSLQQEAHSKFY